MTQRRQFATAAALFLFYLLQSTTKAQPAPGSTFSDFNAAPTFTPIIDCSVPNGCFDCVSGGCAWAIGTCHDSCSDLSEVLCYAIDGVDPATTSTATEVCALQQAQATDAAVCGIQTTCEACTSTSLTSVSNRQPGTPTTCSWYNDRGTCSNLQCDSVGCASPYCPETPEGACYFGATTCDACLALTTSFGSSCRWTGSGSCELNCPIEGECFSPTVQVGSSDAEICQLANDYEDDQQLCLSQPSCSTCTTTQRSDGTFCEWYYDNTTRTGYCGMGGCDSVCSVTSCVGIPNDSPGTPCAALQTLDPTDITCQACLGTNCGWTGTACVSDCATGAPADGPCFTVDPITDTVDGICATAATTTADTAICGAVTNQGCDVCVTTLKSDRRSTCEWYADSFSGAAYCGVGDACDGLGVCPTVICPTTGSTTGTGTGTSLCGVNPTCLSCLNNDCVWLPDDTCVTDCTLAVPGDQCYAPVNFPQQSNFNICSQAATDASNNRDIETDEDPSSGGSGRIATMTRSVVGIAAAAAGAFAVV